MATPAEPPSWVESQGLQRNRQLEAEGRGQGARRNGCRDSGTQVHLELSGHECEQMSTARRKLPARSAGTTFQRWDRSVSGRQRARLGNPGAWVEPWWGWAVGGRGHLTRRAKLL